MRLVHALLLALLFPAVAHAEPPAIDPAKLLASHSHAFAYGEGKLSGPGAELLRTRSAASQFVLFGEDHMDRETPRFAAALYTLLHDEQGFRHLVVEQDPVAIELALQQGNRGDAEALARLAARYPALFEFDSDQDLELLALAGRLEPGADAIWGVEQATGAITYLEELLELAGDAKARALVQAQLDAARRLDPGPFYSVNWLIDAATPAAIEALRTAMNSPPGSRAERLLQALAGSSEVFGYYRRAEAGEFVGLFNNTEREKILKSNFLARYKAVPGTGAPKAMFKFGSNHLYHGKNPTQAFPIGNLAHELAIVNGSEAFGLFVIPLGADYRGFKDYPAWMRPLLPASEPAGPLLIDLRALRPYQRLYRELVNEAEQWELRALINGYDALVLLPGSSMASRARAGRSAYPSS